MFESQSGLIIAWLPNDYNSEHSHEVTELQPLLQIRLAHIDHVWDESINRLWGLISLLDCLALYVCEGTWPLTSGSESKWVSLVRDIIMASKTTTLAKIEIKQIYLTFQNIEYKLLKISIVRYQMSDIENVEG